MTRSSKLAPPDIADTQRHAILCIGPRPQR
jgi:hypothetical protein